MHLSAKITLGTAIATGRLLMVQIILYENSSIPPNPANWQPTVSTIQESFDHTHLASTGNVRTVTVPIRPILDALVGRQYQIKTKAVNYGAAYSGDPIDIYVKPDIHWTEIK
jgi:hypothetical protein